MSVDNVTLTHSLWIKPTEASNSSFIGITTLHVSGSLSARHQEFLAVHRLWLRFMQLWWPDTTRSSTPGSIGSSQLHKTYQSRCTAKNSWWRAERLPETCTVVIPIKLELGTSVGFIHKGLYVGTRSGGFWQQCPVPSLKMSGWASLRWK